MIIRTMSGELLSISNEKGAMSNGGLLLEFLGVKKDVVGVHKVSGDVELIASVPIIKEQRTENKENNQDGFMWTLSTYDLDRYGERIDPQGWDFKRYLENPVVEWAHRYDIPAIGKIEGMTIDNDGLHGLVYFNDKSFDPFGWSIGQRVKAGVIRAGSVGFRVMEIEIPDKATAQDGTSLIFRKQELLEFSICNVPANPYALTNEKLGMRNEKSNNVDSFWNGLFQGAMSNDINFQN